MWRRYALPLPEDAGEKVLKFLIFSGKTLSLFPKGAFNIHPSLLPRWRGPSPVPAAILAQDAETGVSLQRISREMDAGNLLAVTRIPLTGTETTGALLDRLALLGAELVRREGFPCHALVCERHTGAGISLQRIEEQNLPVPHREMIPLTLEEQIICFADKFFSKTHLDREKSVAKARKSIEKHGEEGVLRFDTWCKLFL